MTVRNIRQYKDWKDPDVPIGNEWQYDDIDWIRNPSWPAMPTISDYTDQQINFLAAIDSPGSALVVMTLRNNYVGATYTIDWGDGNIETFTTTVASEFKEFYHTYDYNNSNLDGTNAPATITSSVFTRNNHGYPDGYKLFLNDIVGPTNINDYTQYYIVNSTTNTFQIAATKGGSPITLNANGTVNLLGYKLAIVQATCDMPINYYSPYPYDLVLFTGAQNTWAYDMNWLQIDVCLPELDSLQAFRGSTQTQRYYQTPRLEVFNGYNLGITSSFNYMFAACTSLRAVPILNIPEHVKDVQGLFYGCSSLEYVPDDFVGDQIVYANSMFTECRRLRRAPKLNLSNATGVGGMFLSCFSLEYVPNIKFSKAADCTNIFYNCFSLETCDAEFPILSRASGMFHSCTKLRRIPKGVNFNTIVDSLNMFYNCNGLEDYHINIDMPFAKDISGMFFVTPIKSVVINAPKNARTVQLFYGCRKLRKVRGNFGKLKEARQMFYDCRSLIDASEVVIDGSELTDTAQMFQGNYVIKKIPFFDTSNISVSHDMFNGCHILTEMPEYVFTDKLRWCYGMFASCHSLETVPASFGFDTALSKALRADGMFNSCYTLKELPWTHIDMSNSQFCSSMFARCYIIKHVPKITVGSKCTSAYDMFRECMILEYIPKVEGFQHVQDVRYMFYGCRSLKEFPDLDYSGATLIDNQTHNTLTFSYKKDNGTNLGASGSLSGSIYLRYGQLSSTEIDRFFTNLADISSATSITIQMQNQTGISGADVSIATNKGWTITV